MEGAWPLSCGQHNPGAAPKYPDTGQRRNGLAESHGDRIWSGAGFFSLGFPNLNICLNFSLGGIYLFGAFGAATLAAGVRVGEGFIGPCYWTASDPAVWGACRCLVRSSCHLPSCALAPLCFSQYSSAGSTPAARATGSGASVPVPAILATSFAVAVPPPFFL